MLATFQHVVVEGDAWIPSAEDKDAAWQIYVEFRTQEFANFLRQPTNADEQAELARFLTAIREVQKEHGHHAFVTASLTNAFLHSAVFPFTEHWNRERSRGNLEHGDMRRLFRRELEVLEEQVSQFQTLLLRIARGTESRDFEPPNESKKIDLGDEITFDILLGLPDRDESLLAAEGTEVMDRRRAVGLVAGRETGEGSTVNNLAGLAISGGGIRSSTFALGVVQGLARHGIFQHVDFISTVSGGGYLGSFLSTFLNNDSPACGPRGDQAPFKPDIARDSQAIRSLRNNSRNMQPAGFLPWLTTVGQVAFGIASNLVILSFLVFVAVLLTHYSIGPQLREYHELVYSSPTEIGPLPDEAWTLHTLSQVLGVAFGCLLFCLPVAQKLRRARGRSSSKASPWELATVITLAVSGLVVLLDYLPNMHYGFMRVMRLVGEWLPAKDVEHEGWSLTATSVAVANALGLLIARARWIRNLASAFPIVGGIVFLLLWLCGPVLFGYAYFELCRVYIASTPVGIVFLGLTIPAHCVIWMLAVGSFVYSFTCNVNFTSLHRFYRNRLSQTFLLRGSETGEPLPVERQPLSKLRKVPGSTAPYHLVNAALNLPSSDIDELRGRESDFFVFSKHFCGSPVVGYQSTVLWEEADSHLDLGTAMAISGAAAAPQMGMISMPSVSFLMTLLNVRMGYWLRKPFRTQSPAGWLSRLLGGPGPLYLCREAFHRAHQGFPYLNLSDGGHLENLGVFELLRRRCKYIIAIDGECDPELVFPSLRQLQRFASVDLGVSIEIRVDDVAWEPMNANESNDSPQTQPRYSRQHFAIGRIVYPEVPGRCSEAVGWLIYVKLSVTGNEPTQVTDYRRRHPDAPHQTTADQVFEEDQFEAYRSLGEHISDDLFFGHPSGSSRQSQADLTIDEWVSGLANEYFET
ncbi:MAG: patatin-like phospholipase family protein [Planctomycetota bacterium]